MEKEKSKRSNDETSQASYLTANVSDDFLGYGASEAGNETLLYQDECSEDEHLPKKTKSTDTNETKLLEKTKAPKIDTKMFEFFPYCSHCSQDPCWWVQNRQYLMIYWQGCVDRNKEFGNLKNDNIKIYSGDGEKMYLRGVVQDNVCIFDSPLWQPYPNISGLRRK